MKHFGIALSGGGYRAAAYHLGTLNKLRELNLLDSVDIISSNSGGSITAATYVLHSGDYDKFYHIMFTGVQHRNLVKGVLNSPRILLPLIGMLIYFLFMGGLMFTGYSWINLILLPLFVAVFLNYQYVILPFSKFNEQMYDIFFYKGAKLSDFQKKPEIIINSTNLETGTLFTFSRTRMWDTSYLYDEHGDYLNETFKAKDYPIARAVTASSCVPFAFSPVRIKSKYYYREEQLKTVHPVLVDGGVYDNQGGHKLTYKGSDSLCKFVLISDAGGEMPRKHIYKNVLSLLIRTMDVFMKRIKTIQVSKYLYNVPKGADTSVAYQSLGKDVEEAIPKFILSLKEGEISAKLITQLHINPQHIKDGKWEEITLHLKEEICYARIIKANNTPDQLKIARSVGTNLTPLKEDEIEALMRHAYVSTEIQLRLYCPGLFKV